MSSWKYLVSLLSGTVLGLLFAKKDGKKLRDRLKGKDSKEVAEILGKEMIEAGRDVKDVVEEISETDEVKKFEREVKKSAAKGMKKAKKVINKQVPKAKKAIEKQVPKIKKALQKKFKK